MSKAVIVFADGSKQMAHNLDDTRFRWHERKLAQADQILAYHSTGIVVRDCTSPKDIDQACRWQIELKLQLSALQQQRQILVASEPRRYQQLQDTLQLRVAIQDIQGQLSYLKQHVAKARGGTNPMDDPSLQAIHKRELLEANRNLQHELLCAQAEIIRLQRLLIEQFGVEAEVVYGEVQP